MGRPARKFRVIPSVAFRKCDWPNFLNLAVPAFMDLLLKLTWMLGSVRIKTRAGRFSKTKPEGQGKRQQASLRFLSSPPSKSVSPISPNTVFNRSVSVITLGRKRGRREIRGVLSIKLQEQSLPSLIDQIVLGPPPFSVNRIQRARFKLFEPKGSVVGAYWTVWEKESDRSCCHYISLSEQASFFFLRQSFGFQVLLLVFSRWLRQKILEYKCSAQNFSHNHRSTNTQRNRQLLRWGCLLLLLLDFTRVKGKRYQILISTTIIHPTHFQFRRPIIFSYVHINFQHGYIENFARFERKGRWNQFTIIIAICRFMEITRISIIRRWSRQRYVDRSFILIMDRLTNALVDDERKLFCSSALLPEQCFV